MEGVGERRGIREKRQSRRVGEECGLREGRRKRRREMKEGGSVEERN